MISTSTAIEGDPIAAQKISEQQTHSPIVEQDAAKMVAGLAPDDSTPSQLAAATDKMIAETVKFDDFYQLGRYTYIVCLFAELLILAQVGNMLYMTYAGAAPKLTGCGDFKFDLNNDTKKTCDLLQDIFNDTSYFNDTSLNNLYNCTPSNITLDFEFLSVNVEFDYYCKTQEVKTTISYQMIGVIVGSMVFGYLSDSYGRKKIMLIALICCILSMVATSYTNDLIIFTFVRFFVNFFNAGTMVILVVFTSEHYPKNHRFCLTNLITWSPNFVFFAIMAWLANDWRTLQRVSALFAVPCIFLLLYLSESPRYLIQSRRIDEARAAILRMHKIDGRNCDEAVVDRVLEEEQRHFSESSKKQQKYNYFHLFYTWRFTRYTLAIALSFLAVSLMNYSLLYNMEKVSGSIYLNGILLGLFRYSMNLSIAFLDLRFASLGRKFAHFVADGLITIALCLHVVIYLLDLKQELSFVSRAAILSVIGFCSLLYTTNGLAANELFPTGVRNTSYSFGQVLSRIGVVLAPQLFLLTNVWELLPYLTLMTLAIIDAIFFQFNVVETKNKPMLSKFPSEEQRVFYGRLPFRRGERGRKADVELLPRGENNIPRDSEDGVAVGIVADDANKH